LRTSFWKVAWREDIAFRVNKYPRLYSISNQHDALVSNVGLGSDWLFTWRHNLFIWEEELLNLVKEDLACFVWYPGVEDRWKWKSTEKGLFTVKSTYDSS